MSLCIPPCLAIVAIFGILFAWQFFLNRDRFDVNKGILENKYLMASIRGDEDRKKAIRRKEMGMGIVFRMLYSFWDFLSGVTPILLGRFRYVFRRKRKGNGLLNNP